MRGGLDDRAFTGAAAKMPQRTTTAATIRPNRHDNRLPRAACRATSFIVTDFPPDAAAAPAPAPKPGSESPEAIARARLVEALVRTGEEDRVAFRDLYSLTSAKLFGICYRICGERQAAEDVLHDVYLTIWKRAGAYEPSRASPITWLATIARNRAIDWQRAQKVRRSTPIEDAPQILDTAPLASETLLHDEQSHLLQECLELLEQRQRSAIHTAFFDGVTYAELAERQNIPLGTMKSWVRRGLARLRECLER
jgi:RNA polymerase sigma factor (sigma-70 family)